MFKKIKSELTYTRIIAIGFIAVIFAGAGLLMLPVSSSAGMKTDFVDSLFTATSATCVTGLVPFDTYTHWSLFGQIVILTLIQIGGLGFMTVITMFSIFAKKHLSLHERRLLMQSAGSLRMSGITTMIKRVLRGTLFFELAGAILLAIRFCPKMGIGTGIWYSVFHSVSAFCNAGFDLMGRFGESSFTAYYNDPLVCITLMALIVIGGLGFLVWSDIVRLKWNFRKMELHTKIVLVTSAVLILSGGVIFYFTESNGVLSDMTQGEKWMAAFFQSVTTRTAGFNTIDLSKLSNSGSLVSMVFMLIGGSPGSTAGGIKTTTVAVFIVSTIYAARNSDNVVMFKRKIEPSTVRQAGAIVCVYLAATVAAVAVICAIEPVDLRQVAFEVTSAIGTVGLTMNLTSTLSALSKIIIAVLMFAGRIGGLSLMLALAEKSDRVPLERPTEKIMIG